MRDGTFRSLVPDELRLIPFVTTAADKHSARDELLNFFIDRIYVYDDDKRLIVTGWFADADREAGRYEQAYDVGGFQVGFEGAGFERFALNSTTRFNPIRLYVMFCFS